MALAQSNFVFGTDHAHGHLSSDLSFFDFERLTFGGVQHGTHGRHRYFLPFGHVARPAHDVQHLASDVHLAHAKAVCVGVGSHRRHVTHDDARQSAGHIFHVFHTFHLKASGGQNLSGLFHGNIKGEQLLEPTCGNLHETGGL